MTATLFGIKNCDTVKKARRWLDDHNISYQFHDLRIDGLDQQQVETWLQTTDLSTLVNKRSTTWKTLGETHKQQIEDDNTTAVINILLEHPTLIKRPVLALNNNTHVGFKEATYHAIFH